MFCRFVINLRLLIEWKVICSVAFKRRQMETQAFNFAASRFVPVAIGLFSWNSGGRLGLFQCVTGIWLMYCTYAMTVDLALGAKAWV